MTNREKLLAKLTGQNDQDQAECTEWWRESTVEEKLAVWGAIQHHYTDPVMEVMSRFAQLAFSTMAEREGR